MTQLDVCVVVSRKNLMRKVFVSRLLISPIGSIFLQFQWVTNDGNHLIYHTNLFIVHERLWINCKVAFSTRLLMARSCFNWGKTTPDSCYGNPNLATVLVSKSFSPAQCLSKSFSTYSISSLAFYHTKIIKAFISPERFLRATMHSDNSKQERPACIKRFHRFFHFKMMRLR